MFLLQLVNAIFHQCFKFCLILGSKQLTACINSGVVSSFFFAWNPPKSRQWFLEFARPWDHSCRRAQNAHSIRDLSNFGLCEKVPCQKWSCQSTFTGSALDKHLSCPTASKRSHKFKGAHDDQWYIVNYIVKFRMVSDQGSVFIAKWQRYTCRREHLSRDMVPGAIFTNSDVENPSGWLNLFWRKLKIELQGKENTGGMECNGNCQEKGDINLNMCSKFKTLFQCHWLLCVLIA